MSRIAMATAVMIEQAKHGGYVVLGGDSGVMSRGLLFAGELAEALQFIRGHFTQDSSATEDERVLVRCD